VLIKEVDAISAKAQKHSLNDELDVLGLTVEPRATFACFEIYVPTELDVR